MEMRFRIRDKRPVFKLKQMKKKPPAYKIGGSQSIMHASPDARNKAKLEESL